MQLLAQQQNETQRSLNNILGAQNRLQLRMDLAEATITVRAAESVARTMTKSPMDILGSPRWARTLQPTRLRAHTADPGCVIGCKCSSYVRGSIGLSSLHRFLGSLFVGYVGLPFITPKCDDRNCAERARLVTLTTYVFPPWFLARAFHLVFRLLPCAGPELVVRVVRVVPITLAIFNHARTGDLRGLRKLLIQGLGSPFDIDVSTGISARGVSNQSLSMIASSDVSDSTL